MSALAFATGAYSLVRSVGEQLMSTAPEPIWMIVWGVSLLMLASRAKSLRARRDERVSMRRVDRAALDLGSSAPELLHSR